MSMSRFADSEGKIKLEIFDPEKEIVICLYLNQEEYDRANADMSYATELLHIYENSMNMETQVAENLAQAQSSSQTSSLSEDGFWSHAETQLLINLYGQHKDDFANAKKKKYVWNIIAEKMNAYNYNRPAAKIERKWINLLRVYRSIKDNKSAKKTGRGAQNYKFFDALDEILGDKPSNSNTFCIEVGVNKDQPNTDQDGPNNNYPPESVPSTSNTSNQVAASTTSSYSDSLSETPSLKHKRKSRSSSQSDYYLQAKTKRHEDKMKIEQQRLQLEREKIALLEKILEIQMKKAQ